LADKIRKLCLAVKKEKDTRLQLTRERKDLEKTGIRRSNSSLLSELSCW
jgi:hypothetical protein